jgi:hypothetical protein
MPLDTVTIPRHPRGILMARLPKPWFREDRQAYFVTINGIRHNLGPDKKAADRQFHELMATVDQPATPPAPVPIASARLTVGQVFEKYLDWCERHRSRRTYVWTQAHIQSFCDHLKNARTMLAGELKPFHLMEWVESKKTWGANHRHELPSGWCPGTGVNAVIVVLDK